MTKTARDAQERAPGLSPEQTSQCLMVWAYITPPKYNQVMPKHCQKYAYSIKAAGKRNSGLQQMLQLNEKSCKATLHFTPEVNCLSVINEQFIK